MPLSRRALLALPLLAACRSEPTAPPDGWFVDEEQARAALAAQRSRMLVWVGTHH
jgi:hypothetical protein